MLNFFLSSETISWFDVIFVAPVVFIGLRDSDILFIPKLPGERTQLLPQT
jgi:hypothetical protein